MKKKTLVFLLALVLVVGSVIGGTMAWLSDSTGEVKNTFTTSNIYITLKEEAGGDNKEFKMVPGYTIAKDPKVTVIANSETCYLFVKVEKSENFDSFMNFKIDAEWTPLDGVQNVYYRAVGSKAVDQDFYVLQDNQVNVKDTVTKKMMDDLTEYTAYPTLTVTAYASQFYKKNNNEENNSFTAKEAWNNISGNNQS